MTKSKPRVGRPRLANPSLKTLRNRASAANANLKRALPQLVTNAKARNQKRVKNRQRAEKNPPPEVIVRSLLAKHAGKSTWKQFIDTKQDISDDQHLGIYRNKVTRLAKSLRANVGGVVFTRRSSRLDPWKAIPLYLQIANRNHLHHEGTYKRSINIFIDGCEVACYKPAGVVTLSLTLPTLRVPHQVSAVLHLSLRTHGQPTPPGPQTGQTPATNGTPGTTEHQHTGHRTTARHTTAPNTPNTTTTTPAQSNT